MEQLLCNEPVAAMGFLAALFTIAVSVGMWGMILSRERFTGGVKLLEEDNPLAFISPDILKFRHSFQITLPKCAVVMPVKGVHEGSADNWRSQVTSMYGGPLNFLFVVESEADPAFAAIRRLIAELSEFSIKLLVAGETWHCSQKMHNQLTGFEAALGMGAKYVILLDDDIHLHPGTIRYWVEEMESDPKVLVASGYTFDWVGPGVRGWPAYLWMMWRLVAAVGFNDPKDRPKHIWGGAMMFRAEELRRNVCSLMDAWADGGYSEDWASHSLARYHGRTLCVPKAALFPTELGEVSWPRFTNYLKRQLFVLTSTWASPHQRYLAYGAQLYNNVMGVAAIGGVVTACPLVALLAARAVGVGDGAPVLGTDGRCAEPALGAAAFAASMLLVAYTCKRAVRAYAGLCTTLSPMDTPVQYAHMSLWRLAGAYLGYCLLVPLICTWCFCCNSVIWSGVRYTFRGGKVHTVHRRNTAGEWYTQSRAESMEKAFRRTAERSLAARGLE